MTARGIGETDTRTNSVNAPPSAPAGFRASTRSRKHGSVTPSMGASRNGAVKGRARSVDTDDELAEVSGRLHGPERVGGVLEREAPVDHGLEPVRAEGGVHGGEH